MRKAGGGWSIGPRGGRRRRVGGKWVYEGKAKPKAAGKDEDPADRLQREHEEAASKPWAELSTAMKNEAISEVRMAWAEGRGQRLSRRGAEALAKQEHERRRAAPARPSPKPEPKRDLTEKERQAEWQAGTKKRHAKLMERRAREKAATKKGSGGERPSLRSDTGPGRDTATSGEVAAEVASNWKKTAAKKAAKAAHPKGTKKHLNRAKAAFLAAHNALKRHDADAADRHTTKTHATLRRVAAKHKDPKAEHAGTTREGIHKVVGHYERSTARMVKEIATHQRAADKTKAAKVEEKTGQTDLFRSMSRTQIVDAKAVLQHLRS